MRTFIQRLSVFVVVLAWAHTSSAQTADEIIEKSIAAMGGRAAMEKIKSRQMTGTMDINTPAGPIQATVEMLYAAPNKARTLINADLSAFGAGKLTIDNRFDGTTGYAMDTMQGNREITGLQLENLKANSFPHPFLNYKASGASVKLDAPSKVGDRAALVLVFEPPSGTPIKQFIDAETFLPIRTVMTTEAPQVGRFEQTVDASDYRAIDGVKVPFKLNMSSSVQSVTITFTKQEQNVAVDEKLFVKPQ